MSWTQRIYLLGAAFLGAAIGESDPNASKQLMMIGFGIWFAILLKWFVWDGTRSSWADYKKEKADLFETIKQGKQQ